MVIDGAHTTLCSPVTETTHVFCTVFGATVHKTVHPMLLDHCLSVCPFVLSCGQMVAWTMPIGMELGHGPGHIALDGNPAPIAKGAQPSPIFGPCLLWPVEPAALHATAKKILFTSLHALAVLRGHLLPSPL